MSATSGMRQIAVVSACMQADGTPTFVLNHVEVTHDQAANGIHYYLAEAELIESGYEEPFVHFDEDEAPPFLHSAVRRHLGIASSDTDQPIHALMENA